MLNFFNENFGQHLVEQTGDGSLCLQHEVPKFGKSNSDQLENPAAKDWRKCSTKAITANDT